MGTIRRDAANELYDRACDLVVAADGIRRAAALPGSAVAMAATLGCIEASLEALVQATAAMRRETARGLQIESAAGSDAGDLRQAFADLLGALEDADRAADELRHRAGPLLARRTLG